MELVASDATFEPATDLMNGYYLIELDGTPGGIASKHGRLLDGEYRDTHIAGYASPHGWEVSPSGDGLPGGDYRAAFVISAPELVVDVHAAAIAEDAGGSAATATVSRRYADLSSPVVVTLAVSDPTEASVPATVTIPSGQSSVSFAIGAIDDERLDGAQSVGITASAPAFQSGGGSLFVTDVERLIIAPPIEPSVWEGERLAVSIEPQQEPPEPLIFSLGNAPEGSRIDPLTGQFVWTPSEAQGPGPVDVTVHATTRDSQQPYATVIMRIGVLDAAPWQYHADPEDVNADGTVDPLDALLVINYLNRLGIGPLPPAPPQDATVRYVDVDGNGSAAPIDALRVINRLNRNLLSVEASGEGGPSLLGFDLFTLAAGVSALSPTTDRANAAASADGTDLLACSFNLGSTDAPAAAVARMFPSGRPPFDPPRSSSAGPAAAAVDALLSTHLDLDRDFSESLAGLSGRCD